MTVGELQQVLAEFPQDRVITSLVIDRYIHPRPDFLTIRLEEDRGLLLVIEVPYGVQKL